MEPMAASNSLAPKSKLAAAASLKITPANSPILKPASRSPSKPSSYQSTLSLRTVIGTTTSNPNGFSFHESTKSFALCAGSAAVLAELDADLSISQRFFRARPTATGLNPVPSFYNPTNPPSTPDSRPRILPPSTKNGVNGVLHPSAPSPELGETNGSRTWSSRGRIKSVTCVSISPNGYNPRVLIFSTAKDSPLDTPLSIITEHTFGVRSLAFSPDSQYLATLGDINDGFLFIWAVNLKTGAARLHWTNKCTSFVRAMCWMGNNLVTVGIRHVKVWRLAEPSLNSPFKSRFNLEIVTTSLNPAPRALWGRNCLLGNLSENTFTCITSISDDRAIVCSETGAACILDDTNSQQKLVFVKNLGFNVCSIASDDDSGTVWFGGRDRIIEPRSLDEFRIQTLPTPKSLSSEDRHLPCPKVKKHAIIAMGVMSTHMVTVDSTRAIRVCPLDRVGTGNVENLSDTSKPAHRDAVMGIGSLSRPNVHDASFFTWSCGGTINFWNLQGKCRATMKAELEQLPSEDDGPNELKIMRATEDLKMFVSGDRYGVIRTILGDPWRSANEVRAHGGEVTDIAVQPFAGMHLLASSGRDRMVQLFRCVDGSLDLIQTMDEHVGAVGRLLFMNDGEKLLSCSADRTVIIRNRMTREVDGTTIIAFVLSKVITLKASPVSMTLPSDDPGGLVLSTIDRHIHRFDVHSGRQIHSFKATDSESNDTVVMTSLTVNNEVPGHWPRLLIGVSTTDKSIRIYDLDKDTLLAREFGHTEGVSDVILVEDSCADNKGSGKRIIVSTGLDGVIMIWDLSVQQQTVQESPQAPEDATPAKELTAVKPPLRRILSKTELSGFQRFDSPSSPCPVREQSPPRIRKRTSRYTLSPQILKNGNLTPVPTPPLPPPRRSPTSSYAIDGRERRSPSPPSPKTTLKTVTKKSSIASLRRPSLDFRSRTKSSGALTSNSEFGSLNMSTEQVCRTLRAYRKKLSSSTDHLHTASELEKELDLTVRALGERSKKLQVNGNLSDNTSKSPTFLPVKASRIARRMPSTPILRRNAKEKTHRTPSLDADGEG
ncbi:hypothetical protein AJ80_02421 [Polytolypa hystricis UAMH7299]|uniref:Uncharacterized protein n=1 Tax=Polytolypa hystricis (strain UAMH7299) TaxID=1447883 RepID=A0A2B7YS78_POLH7|nr:hypothetical protein AJ80_02421 [Polytolypa hystricis UAMH7299]